MNNEFFDALEALEREKGIPKEFMLERVEAALLAGYTPFLPTSPPLWKAMILSSALLTTPVRPTLCTV